MNRATLFLSCLRSVRGLVLGGAALAGGLAVQLAAQDTAPSGPVVELPKFVVTDNRELPPAEAWRYGEIQGFEILSNASDKTTQRLIRDFEMFKTALGYVWPLPNRGNGPASLILCGRGNKFDAFKPKEKGGSDKVLASLFLKNKDQTAIVIDLQSSSLNLSNFDTTDDASTGTDSTQVSVEHDKQLYREYVRFLLSKSEPRLPAWLEEGMAQIIMRMKVDKKEIIVGELEDPNLVSAAAGQIAAVNALLGADDPNGIPLPGAPAEDRDFNAALQRRRLVPLDQFFAVTPDSPEANNPLGNNVWAKQAYAFVHLCLYGEGKRYQKPFTQFVVRTSKEPVSEELFKQCFGKSYKDMLIVLRGYIDFTNYEKQMFVAKGKDAGLPDPPKLQLRDATEAEVGRIKGEALLLAGNKTKAHAELTAPYIRGERDPRLLAAIGLHEKTGGQEERARKFLEAAVKAKVPNPRAYIEFARYRYADALAQPGVGDKFSAEQVNGVVSLLLSARTLPPALPDTYELMADTWIRSAAPAKRDDVVFLIEGARGFPGRLKLVYQTAVLAAQANMNDAAHPLADYGIQVAPDAKTKAAFEKFKAQLPPLAPMPGSAPTAAPASAPKKS